MWIFPTINFASKSLFLSLKRIVIYTSYHNRLNLLIILSLYGIWLHLSQYQMHFHAISTDQLFPSTLQLLFVYFCKRHVKGYTLLCLDTHCNRPQHQYNHSCTTQLQVISTKVMFLKKINGQWVYGICSELAAGQQRHLKNGCKSGRVWEQKIFV